MIPALAALALKTTLVLAAGFAATALLRRASAAARHLVWSVTLGAVLALPVLSFVIPAWTLPLLPPESAAPVAPPAAAPPAALVATSPAGPIPEHRAASTDIAGAAAEAPASPAPAAAPGAPGFELDWPHAAVALWLVGAALLALRIAAGLARLWWLGRDASMVIDGGWLHTAHLLAQRLGMARGVTLLRGTGARVPMTWGVLRPVVWLPAEAESWSDERRRVVLAHELAHVRRLDALTQWIAHLALAVAWYHPLAWIAARRFREERERACDDVVLALGTLPSVYADHLLDMVRRLGAAAGPAPAMAMARRTQFEGRLLAILDDAAHRGSVTTRAALGSLGLALLGVLPVAAMQVIPREPAATALGEVLTTSVQPHHPSAALATSAAVAAAAETARAAEAAVAAGAHRDEYRRLLAHSLRVAADSDTTLRQIIAAAAEMTSDADKATVLHEVLRHPRLDRGDLAAVFEAVGGMTSDADRAGVLLAALPRASLDDRRVRTTFFEAVAPFTSDDDRAAVLGQAAERLDLDDAGQRAAFLDAVAPFTSDGDRASVLLRALQRSRLSQDALVGLLQAAEPMTSDADKAAVLVDVASRHRLNDAARAAYVAVARTMTADGDRAAALAALVPNGERRSASASVSASASASASSGVSSAVTSASVGASAGIDPAARDVAGDPVVPWTSELVLSRELDHRPSYRFAIVAKDVRVTEYDRRFVGVAPGGLLTVDYTAYDGDTTRVSERRILRITAGRGGEQAVAYHVNGRSRAWDAEGRAWLDGLLRRHTATKRRTK